MENTPTVSIIIPAYNAGAYLADCLESILVDTVSDYEILVVNDGSTDNTQEIAESFSEKNPRVKVITTENSGASAARNTGLDNATGSYIMFVDADDLLLQGALPYMTGVMEEYDPDMVIAWAKHGSGKKPYNTQMGTPQNVMLLCGLDPLRCALMDKLAYCVWAKLYKRELLDGVRFPVGKRIHEDSLFLFKCFLKPCTVAITKTFVYMHTSNPNSITHAAFDDRFLDILDVLDEKLKDIKALYPEFEELSYNLIVKANMALLQNLCKTTEKKYKCIKKEAIKNVIKYKKYFIPTNKVNKRLFFIITHHLYSPYALCCRLKFRKK